MKKPTIKDVAAKACVSTALVSRVMNAPLKADGLPDCVVHPDTARRIMNAVVSLGYHPNKAAVSLRKQLKKRIGVIIPDISNQFFADIAKNIESMARKEGYIVLFGSTNEDSSQLKTLSEAFIEDGVDGIIITPGVDSSKQVSKIIAQGMPVVVIIRDVPDIDKVGKVLTDDTMATKIAIEHLMSKGHTSIDMISLQKRLSNTKRREELYTEIMSSKGLPYKIHHDSASETLEDIKLILEDIIRRDVQAIYCASASIPVRVLQAAREINIRIPDDIALLGYDGGLLYRILSPSISQIEFSREDIASEAFKKLLEIINKHEMLSTPIYLKPKLIAGDSTEKVSICDANYSEKVNSELISGLTKASIVINKALSDLKKRTI